jgi:hypothetical protein
LYYLTWIVFGHIVGIYSPITSVIIVGFLLHVLTATCIGIIAGQPDSLEVNRTIKSLSVITVV